MNIPNLLTAIRFLIIPIFGYYLYVGSYTIAVFLFLLGGLTDVLDGYIARRHNMVTSWGKLADPLADKLMQLTALIILTVVKGLIPVWLLVIVALKESLMAVGSAVLYKQDNYVVSSSWYGKMATVVFYFAIVMIIFEESFGHIFKISLSHIFIIIALLATLFAFFMYARIYYQIKNSSDRNAIS